MVIPSFGPDTCLVLNKQAAIIQANKLNEIPSFKARLEACIQRERSLEQLWDNTRTKLEKTNVLLAMREKEISILNEASELQSAEIERLNTLAKKERIKGLLIGGGVGVCVGAVLVSILN